MPKSSLIPSLIHDQNADRLPQFLRLKYLAMSQDHYRFFRATTELFYNDLAQAKTLQEAPAAWVCGDLHLENFGSYKGESRLSHFAVNDFDEAFLAPAVVDPFRFICSLHAAAPMLKIPQAAIDQMAAYFLKSYFSTLSVGYIRGIERETAKGIMRDFLNEITKRKRKKFLDKKTIKRKSKRSITLDNVHTAAIDAQEQAMVEKALQQKFKGFADPQFYKVIDVAARIAGTSSLGLRRFAVLVQGKGSPDGNYLLDIKETRKSALQSHILLLQPHWPTEAHRIVEVQQRILDDPPAMLQTLDMGGRNYVLKELQPTADRINYALFKQDGSKMKELLTNMAQITAWGVLRSQGRQGAATADDYMYWASNSAGFQKLLVQSAKKYAKQFDVYHKSFQTAFQKGYFAKQMA